MTNEGMSDDNREFLEGIDKKAEKAEAIGKVIKELDAQQLGKAVILHSEDTNKSPADTITDLARPSEAQGRLVGYILPIREDNLKHLVIVADGTIIITHAQGIEDPMYKKNFTPSIEPLILNYPGFSKVVEYFMNDHEASNINPSEEGQITQGIEQAFTQAGKFKEKREEVKERTIDFLITNSEKFLNPKKVEQTKQKPPEPGESNPPPSTTTL